jgi:hypothetical protein
LDQLQIGGAALARLPGIAQVPTGPTARRLHTCHDADRVIVMEDGQISEMGSHHELVVAGGAYAALWQSWRGGPRPAASEPVIPRVCGQAVDGAVESCHAHGINNRCPVDG